MRCYFMRDGHIADVEPLFGLADDEAVKTSREMFEARKIENRYDGFEVWELSRMILQHFPNVDDSPSQGQSLRPRCSAAPFAAISGRVPDAGALPTDGRL
jgi:hypothetical protein